MYGPRMVFVPKMPALGLLLEYPIFSAYNTKMEKHNAKLPPTDPDFRPNIDFELHRKEIDVSGIAHMGRLVLLTVTHLDASRPVDHPVSTLTQQRL